MSYKQLGDAVIHFEYSCDFRGCTVRAKSLDPNGPCPPLDWGHINLNSTDLPVKIRGVEQREAVEGHGDLCPEHVELVGKLLGRWTGSHKRLDEPPERFR